MVFVQSLDTPRDNVLKLNSSFLKKMKLDLQPRAKKWMESFVGNKRTVTIKGPPKVQCQVEDSGKLIASVECVLCQKDIRIGFEKAKNKLKYTFKRGNFDKHMKIHHKDYVLIKH